MHDLSHLARFDLNLLVALDALLTERSVTRAAERLHLSQPALSASLSRLRHHFDDPILARRGNTHELTPLAMRLSEHTSAALESARRVFESQTNWTPQESTRQFTIYGSDYAFATLGPRVSRLATETAPHVTFHFVLHNPTVVEDAENRLRSVDGILIPHGFLSGLPHQNLFDDQWLVIADAEHPAVQEELTLTDLQEADWVFTYQSSAAFTAAARELQHFGVEPHVTCVVESFVTLPAFVRGTRKMALIQGHLADTAVSTEGLVLRELPYSHSPVVNALWWHPVHDRDPEHAWMRRVFAEAAHELSTPASALPNSGEADGSERITGTSV